MLASSAEPTLPIAGTARPMMRVFGDLRFHTDGELLALALWPNGTLWSVEDPGVLRQWQVATGQPRGWTFLSDLATLWSFSSDGRLLASGSDELSLWDVGTGQLLSVLPQPSWVTAIAVRSGARVATGHDDGVVRLWDPASQQELRALAGHQRPLSAVAFSPDGRRLATAGEDCLICLWDAESGTLLGQLSGHPDRIQALAWHPDGRRLVSAGWDTTARLWDTTTCQPIILLNAHADQVTAMAFSPDGSLLACADSAQAVYVWDVNGTRVLHVLRGHQEEISCLVFSPDGQCLFSGGADQVIHRWDPLAGRLLSGPGDVGVDCVGLALSADGTRLASTRGGAGLQIWSTASGEPNHALQETGPLQVLAASRDGHWLAGGGADNLVRLFDGATGQAKGVLEGQAGRVTAVAFAPDSRTLASASASDGLVWLWNLETGEPSLVIPEAADNSMVVCLAFHPDGRLLAAGGIDWLATGGSDGAIGLWDVLRPGPVATFEGGTTCLAFHPSGRWLAAISLQGAIGVWDVAAQRLDFRLSGHPSGPGCVAYSPDGRWLASGGDDRMVRLWDAVTGEPVAALTLNTQVKALCFSPDGRFLFTGNGNTTSYQLDVGRLLCCKPSPSSDQAAQTRALIQMPRTEGPL